MVGLWLQPILKIYGRIQHVGFRDGVEDIGRGLGIDGVV
jgi:acylphosphatase